MNRLPRLLASAVLFGSTGCGSKPDLCPGLNTQNQTYQQIVAPWEECVTTTSTRALEICKEANEAERTLFSQLAATIKAKLAGNEITLYPDTAEDIRILQTLMNSDLCLLDLLKEIGINAERVDRDYLRNEQGWNTFPKCNCLFYSINGGTDIVMIEIPSRPIEGQKRDFIKTFNGKR